MAVLIAALALRMMGAADAYAGGQLVTLDGDSLYHLRRMRLIADGFPAVPWLDPGIAWPAVAPIPWAAGFDLMGAVFILFGRATGGPAGADIWVASLCPLLGLAVVAATMELVHASTAGLSGRRTMTLTAGILAGAIPLSVATSRFGRIDHHVAEALTMILLTRWAIGALPPRPEADLRRRLAYEAGGAAVSTWALWVFTGSPLYVGLIVPVLLAGAVLAPRSRLLGSGGPGLVAGAGLAALLTAPAVAAHGRALAFGFPSWLQPLLLAAAGFAVCGAAVVGRRIEPGPRRAIAMVAAAVAIGALAALAWPAGAAQASAAIREWLFKSDPWLASIEEFQPLLRSGPTPVAGINRFLGVAGFATPLAVPLAGAALWRAGRARAIGLVGITTALALLTLLQARFGRVFVSFLAASLAIALTWLASLLVRRSRVACVVPIATALAVAAFDPRVRSALGLERDGLPDAAIEAALDLRSRAPGPSQGVLTPWDLGHHFLVVADRPVVITGFGPYPDAAAYAEATRAFTIGEEELLQWLATRRVGWIVGGANNFLGRIRGRTAPIPFSGRGFSTRYFQEVASAPLLVAGSAIPSAGVRHFSRLMPVFASTRTVGGIELALPVLWTFEVVEGAHLRGRAPPGTRVVLEVPLTEHGRDHTWRAFADADAAGAWSMTVPLPTDLSSPALSTAPARLLVGPGPAVAVNVPETAVRAGEELVVPGS